MDNPRLIEIMRKAMGYRIDVECGPYLTNVGQADIFDVFVQLSGGQRKNIRVPTETLIDGRTCGQILDDWLGPEPRDPYASRRQAAWIEERNRFMNHTPAQLARMALDRLRSIPPTISKTPAWNPGSGGQGLIEN